MYLLRELIHNSRLYILLSSLRQSRIFHSGKAMALLKMSKLLLLTSISTRDNLLIESKNLKMNSKRQERYKTLFVPDTAEPNTATEFCSYFLNMHSLQNSVPTSLMKNTRLNAENPIIVISSNKHLYSAKSTNYSQRSTISSKISLSLFLGYLF